MKKNSDKNLPKNQTINEDDFNISITNEHNEQELTSMGETGKSSGIISAINLPRFNVSFSNKKKLCPQQLEQINQKEDNFSMYTNINKIRNNNTFLNDEMVTEVRKIFLIQIMIFSIENYWLYQIKRKMKEKQSFKYIIKK